jgi:hypothetical protein
MSPCPIYLHGFFPGTPPADVREWTSFCHEHRFITIKYDNLEWKSRHTVRERKLCYTVTMHYRRGSITGRVVRRCKTLEQAREVAAQEQRLILALLRDAKESKEVAYWEARGIHTGHPDVATIVLQP